MKTLSNQIVHLPGDWDDSIETTIHVVYVDKEETFGLAEICGAYWPVVSVEEYGHNIQYWLLLDTSEFSYRSDFKKFAAARKRLSR